MTIKLPAKLAHLANAPRGRYQIARPVRFAHRGGEWAGRLAADRAVAYTITFDPGRDRWYLKAAWQPTPVPQVTWEQATAAGVIGVDTNDDHYAAWLLDTPRKPDRTTTPLLLRPDRVVRTIGTPRSGTPPHGSCTGPAGAVRSRSGSRTSTSPMGRPARNTAAARRSDT